MSNSERLCLICGKPVDWYGIPEHTQEVHTFTIEGKILNQLDSIEDRLRNLYEIMIRFIEENKDNEKA